MQKILFDEYNAEMIEYESADVCNVYNQLSKVQLSEIDLLNAFANIFGYKSGWNEFISVNKFCRYYVSFSMSVCSHVRAVMGKLIKFLPSHVSRELLLVAVSFTELNIKNIWNYNINESSLELDFEKYVMWFTEDTDSPRKYLALSPSAALFTKEAIRLKHFQILWPELYSYLDRTFGLSSEYVLLFDTSKWFDYSDRFLTSFWGSEVGQWEIYLNDKKESDRIIYVPIYLYGNGLVTEMATMCYKGLAECNVIEKDWPVFTDDEYVQEYIEYCKKNKHIRDIKFSIKDEFYDNSLDSALSLLKPYLKDHNKVMECTRIKASRMDFTDTIWEYEPRFTYDSAGGKLIYREPWILKRDIQMFLEVREDVDEFYKNYNHLTLINVKHFIDAYHNERRV